MSPTFGQNSDISIIKTMCIEVSSRLEGVNKQFCILTQYSRKIIVITIVMDKKFVFHRKCIENILIQIWDREASLLTHKSRDFNNYPWVTFNKFYHHQIHLYVSYPF